MHHQGAAFNYKENLLFASTVLLSGKSIHRAVPFTFHFILSESWFRSATAVH
jgi:hypothetical protein